MTPHGVNPLAALLVTYVTATVITLVSLIWSRPEKGLLNSFQDVNWASLLLGLAIVGLEMGYLLAYRAGWNISLGSLVANIALALILIPLGVIFFNEPFEPKKIAGIVCCVIGLFLINR